MFRVFFVFSTRMNRRDSFSFILLFGLFFPPDCPFHSMYLYDVQVYRARCQDMRVQMKEKRKIMDRVQKTNMKSASTCHIQWLWLMMIRIWCCNRHSNRMRSITIVSLPFPFVGALASPFVFLLRLINTSKKRQKASTKKKCQKTSKISDRDHVGNDVNDSSKYSFLYMMYESWWTVRLRMQLRHLSLSLHSSLLTWKQQKK